MTPQLHDGLTLSASSAPAGRRSRQTLAALAGAGAFALLAAACGSTAAPGSATSSGPAAASAASAAKVSLSVTFAGPGTAAATHFELRCEPAGGTVADPAAACQKLMSGTSIFGPRPARVMCPMIMTSAARASVHGTYLGRKVHLTVVDGGCDLSRWAKLKSVFR